MSLELNEFQKVLDFHGCYCPDIAMGYRVAKALIREFDINPLHTKDIVAEVGQMSCALDAIQCMCGCTLGKRNLSYTDSGKATFVLRSMSTGKAVRIYAHYWEGFDQAAFKALKAQARQSEATEDARKQLKVELDRIIHGILQAPESELFSIKRGNMTPLERQSGFETCKCEKCGEYVDIRKVLAQNDRQLCPECSK